jgi:hypothetical protein
VRTLLLVSAEEYSDGRQEEYAQIQDKLSGGRIVQATIKAILEKTDGVRLQVSFGEETALIYLWQVVKTNNADIATRKHR